MKFFSVVILLVASISLNSPVLATTIIQCELPDGSIEFTNKGCSKSNPIRSKKNFSIGMTDSYVTKAKTSVRKQKPFNQASFVQIQKQLLASKSLSEMEKHAQTITEQVKASAQRGQLNAAYDMIAATYVRLSKFLKNKQWQGQSVDTHTIRIRTYFESILISQSTTSTAEEFNEIIQHAWNYYQLDS